MKRFSLIILAIITITTVLSPIVSANAPHYVALGDSVAAGAGLARADDTVCDRSTQAYPNRVAAQLGTTVEHLACTGAKVDEGIYGEQKRGGMAIAPQLDAAFAAGTPDIITLTIGANDARWTQFLRDCYTWKCGSTFDNARAKVYRADLRVELYWTLQKIEQMSEGDPPRVLLNGYYNPLATTVCSGTERITVAERSWLRARTADLNQAIRSVTPLFSFAEYVPISFAGHEICSSSPWVQGMDDTAPFHPTAAGQAAIANANVNVLNRTR